MITEIQSQQNHYEDDQLIVLRSEQQALWLVCLGSSWLGYSKVEVADMIVVITRGTVKNLSNIALRDFLMHQWYNQ